MIKARRRSVMLSKEKPRQIVQDYAIDQFGELPARKRTADERARRNGHMMMGWRRRANDPAGRWNNYCQSCNKVAVVCTETPEGFTDIYGDAVTAECQSCR